MDALGWDLRSVTGSLQSNNNATKLTTQKIVDKFWSLTSNQSALEAWIDETEQIILAHVANEKSRAESEQQDLEQQQLEIAQQIEILKALEKEQKTTGNTDIAKQTKSEIDQLKKQSDQLEKQLKESEKAWKELEKDLSKWQAGLLKELDDNRYEFENISEKDLIKKRERVQKEQEKLLEKLAKQDGVDGLLSWGGWSNTSYTYRFWQSVDIESGEEMLLEGSTLQMVTPNIEAVATPEPISAVGFLGVTLLGKKILRKRQ
ncbi:MAG: hypothetical protein F6K11_37560 [Leptolyngbya sp. SIO3F4]|nr:hypothetical protein [Leptolyngbya sp. SIO3F4]